MEMLRGATFEGLNSGFGQPPNDDKTICVFYWKSVIDGVKSNEAGRPINKDVAYVKLMQPGETQHTVYDQPATNAEVGRFPRQWAAFQENKPQGVVGSPLSLLFPTSPATVENLNRSLITTVEQLAAATDTALQGMGMGARQFQEKAKAYLAKADAGKDFHAIDQRLTQMEGEREADKKRIADLEAALDEAQEAQKRRGKVAA